MAEIISNPKKQVKGLAELLIEKNLITEAQLEIALKEQKRTGERLGQILIRRGFVTQQALGKTLEAQVGTPYVHLPDYNIDLKVVKILPENLIRRYKALPIKREGNSIIVAMRHPINVMVLDEIKLHTGMRVAPMITTDRELTEAINKIFDIKEKATKAIQEFKTEKGVGDTLNIKSDAIDGEISENDVPVVKLVNSIIIGAINSGASDIHLDPQHPQMRVRYRVDGILNDVMMIPPYMEKAAISRIKIMSGMNIAERRLPQDGQITFTYEEKQYDLRVATMPIKQGEKVTIRLLDKEKVLIGLTLLGMMPDELEMFESLINIPWGMIIVAGPTGTGKTTTLYGVLSQLNVESKNIITIEDPVEFNLVGINQIQVNPKAGTTFATGLRSVLRQDPNVVMVGEIRDEETASVAVNAALTGQLVLSSIHTTDAPSVLIRLLEMKIEPYLVSSTVVAVVAQRLVRMICTACREKYVLDNKQRRQLHLLGIKDEEIPPILYRGKGCAQCQGAGYKSRTGIFEIMKMNKELRHLISNRASSSELREAAIKSGMRTLFESGMLKVRDGVTTIDEIIRVAYKED